MPTPFDLEQPNSLS